MAVIASGEMEDVEWLDEDQVDLRGVTMPPLATELYAIPVVADLDGDPWELE